MSLRWLIGVACGWLPVVVDRNAIARAAALTELAEGPAPYFVADHAFLLYLWAPLVVASAGLALLTPGLLLTAGSRRDGISVWLIRAVVVTLPLVSVAAALAQSASGAPVVRGGYVVLLAGVSVAAWWWGRRRSEAGARRDRPTSDWATTVMLIAVPAALFAALAPKFLWESVNGDGAHALETARLAVRQFLPFWDPASGQVAGFPGMGTVLFAYPASWFLRLFGEYEVAVRVPYLLVLAATHAAIVAVASHGRSALGRREHALIWLGLVAYTVVQAYSSTYDPYSADISMPGLPDTLQVFTFLTFIHAYLARTWGWCAAALVLTLLSSPAGVLLAALWLAAVAVCGGPTERPYARRTALGLAAMIAILAFVPAGLRLFSLPEPGNEHGLLGLVARFAFLQFTDWRRVIWIVVPSGIFPFVAVFLWRRLDAIGRSLLVVAAAYFAVFFVQAHVMVHYFVPAMLLPPVAFWRLERAAHGWRGPAAAGAAGIAIWASLPQSLVPVVAAREVGRTIEDRGGGYDRLDPASFRRAELLSTLFPKDYEPSVPWSTYGGSPLAWAHYAQRPDRGAAEINYVLVGPGAAGPPGSRQVSVNEAGALYVLRDAVWQKHRAIRPPTPAGSRLYWTPRGILFRSVPLEGGPWILDLPRWLERMGVDVEGLARTVGLARSRGQGTAGRETRD